MVHTQNHDIAIIQQIILLAPNLTTLASPPLLDSSAMLLPRDIAKLSLWLPSGRCGPPPQSSPLLGWEVKIKVRKGNKNVEVLMVVGLHIPQQKQRCSLTLSVT